MITIRGQPKLCLKLGSLVFWQCAHSKLLTNNSSTEVHAEVMIYQSLLSVGEIQRRVKGA